MISYFPVTLSTNSPSHVIPLLGYPSTKPLVHYCFLYPICLYESAPQTAYTLLPHHFSIPLLWVIK